MGRYLNAIAAVLPIVAILVSAAPASAAASGGDAMSGVAYGQARADWVDCRKVGGEEECDVAIVEVTELRYREPIGAARGEHYTRDLACVQLQRHRDGGREQLYEFGCAVVPAAALRIDGMASAALSPSRIPLDARFRCTPEGCEDLPDAREVTVGVAWRPAGATALNPDDTYHWRWPPDESGCVMRWDRITRERPAEATGTIDGAPLDGGVFHRARLLLGTAKEMANCR